MFSASAVARRFAVCCVAAGVPAMVAGQSDTTPPELTGRGLLESVGSETTGGRWFVYITEPLDEDSVPARAAFQFQIGGVDRDSVLTGVDIGYGGHLVLTLGPPPLSSSEVCMPWRLVYTPPSENPLQDLASNLMEAFDSTWTTVPRDENDRTCSGPPPEPEPEAEPPPPPPPVLPPQAGFAVDVPCADRLCRARTGEDVTFTDTSSGTVTRRSWDFGVSAGRTPSGATTRHAWSSPGFYGVTLTVSGAGEESTASRVFLVEAANPAGTCEPDAETICLQDSRYQVRATWRSPEGELLPARAVHAGTNDSGLFRFHDAENWEVLVKVLEGCAITGADWVFTAAATSLGFEIEVTDTVTGAARLYGHEPGGQADAVTDTEAFTDRCGSG